MKNFNLAISSVSLFFSRHQKMALGLLGFTLVIGTYIYSKSEQKKTFEYYKEEAPVFEKGQLLEKQSVEFYRDKDKLYRQETKQLKQQNEEITDQLIKLEKLVSGLAEQIDHAKARPTVAEKRQVDSNDEENFKDSGIHESGQVGPLLVGATTPSRQFRVEGPDAIQVQHRLGSAASTVREARENALIQTASYPDIVSFPVKKGERRKEAGPVLPSGSYAKGAVLTGIDAATGRTLPSLIELDFAYISPNQTKVDLRGCYLIMKASADISSERVEMQPERLSCVSRAGAFFEEKTNGFVADGHDNRFAMRGKIIENFGNKILKATLASAIEGAGKAIQLGQTQTNVNPLGGQSTTISGDTAKYVGAGAASSSASMIAKWYLEKANKILPVVRVESGKAVWVVMTEKVQLPKSFFNRLSKEKVNVPKFNTTSGN